ncbi:MAG: hypothetical protein OEM67_08655 [Thermoleophilia bacterium]|nr:hypothetical protein [Thermoleophilia bacterium]MDH3725371.1 hypothetical protein [Thermoleophilia bacterium]
MSTKEPTRRGRIGVEIFEQVEKLVSDEGLTRTQAFERISEETGRRSGTVAANYYRIARQRGASLQPRGRRGARGGGGSSKDADAVLKRASDVMGELASLVKQQAKELNRLREQSAQFEKFKKWMDKNA